MKLIFATGNAHKMEEIRAILAEVLPEGTEVLSMKEAGVAAEPEENGATFAENALIKARAVRELLDESWGTGTMTHFTGDNGDGSVLSPASQSDKQNRPQLSPAPLDASSAATYILADDSGLCIDYLDGAPGIYSARFMGHDTSYEEKNLAIIEKLKGVEGSDRSARFTCAVAVVMPDGSEFTVTEHMEGEIAHAPAGCGGFGYDPIFYLPEYGCTDAELPPGGKNKISHRGKALRAAVEELKRRA